MNRYSIIPVKRKREIVLLRGRGCAYQRCTFCDYHLDRSADDGANFALNSAVLAQVTGQFGDLEVINSGSVFELDDRTLGLIRQICAQRGIATLHFESHWLYRDRITDLRRDFAGVEVRPADGGTAGANGSTPNTGVSLKMKLGLETFDRDLRERVLRKGIPESDPAAIAAGFDEANLLVGITGQTLSSLERDIELGLAHFERICVNVMCPNTTPVKPDPQVIALFREHLYPQLVDDPRVDVLVENTDFGVGAPCGADAQGRAGA